MNFLLNYGSRSLLKPLDRNGDGYVTEEDFVIAAYSFGLGGRGDAVIRNVFRQLDRNRNGRLETTEALGAFHVIKNLVQGGGLSTLLSQSGGYGAPYGSGYGQMYGQGYDQGYIPGSPYISGYGYGYGSRY